MALDTVFGDQMYRVIFHESRRYAIPPTEMAHCCTWGVTIRIKIDSSQPTVGDSLSRDCQEQVLSLVPDSKLSSADGMMILRYIFALVTSSHNIKVHQ